MIWRQYRDPSRGTWAHSVSTRRVVSLVSNLLLFHGYIHGYISTSLGHILAGTNRILPAAFKHILRNNSRDQ